MTRQTLSVTFKSYYNIYTADWPLLELWKRPNMLHTCKETSMIYKINLIFQNYLL